MLLCGVTVGLLERGPPDGVPELPELAPGIGPERSKRCESAIPVSLRFQLWIIVDGGLVPGFTSSVCESVEDVSLSDSREPGKAERVGGDPPAAGDAGLVDDLRVGGGEPL